MRFGRVLFDFPGCGKAECCFVQSFSPLKGAAERSGAIVPGRHALVAVRGKPVASIFADALQQDGAASPEDLSVTGSAAQATALAALQQYLASRSCAAPCRLTFCDVDKRRALAASRRAEVAVARQLHVRIMRASGLKSVQVFGAQDPYVKVRVFDLRPFPDMPY